MLKSAAILARTVASFVPFSVVVTMVSMCNVCTAEFLQQGLCGTIAVVTLTVCAAHPCPMKSTPFWSLWLKTLRLCGVKVATSLCKKRAVVKHWAKDHSVALNMVSERHIIKDFNEQKQNKDLSVWSQFNFAEETEFVARLACPRHGSRC